MYPSNLLLEFSYLTLIATLASSAENLFLSEKMKWEEHKTDEKGKQFFQGKARHKNFPDFKFFLEATNIKSYKNNCHKICNSLYLLKMKNNFLIHLKTIRIYLYYNTNILLLFRHTKLKILEIYGYT